MLSKIHPLRSSSGAAQTGIASTGLRLAIVKDLVERHEAPLGVSVHSTVGEGTTFTVVLPMARWFAVTPFHLQVADC